MVTPEKQQMWDERWLTISSAYAEFSKDPSKKIGAVIVKDNRVISAGWNGLPRNIEDTKERLTNKDVKYSMIVHAELNAVFNAAYHGQSINESTLYVYGLPPCSNCVKGLIQTGIKRIVAFYDPAGVNEKWRTEQELSVILMKEAGIRYDEFLSSE